MRILIATLYPNYGGSTKVLIASHQALSRHHETELRGQMENAASRQPVAFPTHTLSSLQHKFAVVPLLLRLIYSEWRHVTASRPDVIYVHDTPSLVVYGLIAKLRRIPLVQHVHGPEGSGIAGWLKNRLSTFKIHIARFLINPGDSTPWALIANPVEPPVIAARTRSGFVDIFMAASIADRKNQLLAVDVIAELRRRGHASVLHLCGSVLEPDYLALVEKRIRELDLAGRVVFEGVWPAKAIFERADVILCPSKAEAQTLAVIEALALEVPVVASRIDAHIEIAATIGEDSNSCILADLTATAFADAIEAINPETYARAGRVARAHFSPDRFERELVAAFNKLTPTV